MTAAPPPPPPDGEVCASCGRGSGYHVASCPNHRRETCPTCALPGTVPAAPAEPVEPPAADSPTDGDVDPVTGHVWDGLRWTVLQPPAEAQQYRHGGHQPWCEPDCTAVHNPPVPAEAQQDEDPAPSCRGGAHGLCVSGPRCGCTCHEPPSDAIRRAFATRPSADTETLRLDPDRISDLLRGEQVGTEVIRSDDARRLANRLCAALDAR